MAYNEEQVMKMRAEFAAAEACNVLELVRKLKSDKANGKRALERKLNVREALRRAVIDYNSQAIGFLEVGEPEFVELKDKPATATIDAILTDAYHKRVCPNWEDQQDGYRAFTKGHLMLYAFCRCVEVNPEVLEETDAAPFVPDPPKDRSLVGPNLNPQAPSRHRPYPPAP